MTDFYNNLEIPHDTPESRRTRNYCNGYDEDSHDEYFQKQVVLQEREDVWEAKQRKEIADSMEVIEKDVKTVNEIFRDLAQIVNVGIPRNVLSFYNFTHSAYLQSFYASGAKRTCGYVGT